MTGPALPRITADDLTRAQRKGTSCASCRKHFPRPSVPTGITPAGEVLMRCTECVAVLEPHALIGPVDQPELIGPFDQPDRSLPPPAPALPRARLGAPAPVAPLTKPSGPQEGVACPA
jgi:hypothetical protein